MNHSFSRRDLLQNLVIGLLLCTTIGLFIQTQLYNLGEEPLSFVSNLLSPISLESLEEQSLSAPLSAPVAVAVSSSFGRYGSPHVSTQDETISDVNALLVYVLNDLPTTATASSQSAFLQAVDGTSIYYDFQTALPCNIIVGMLHAPENHNQTVMRRLVLAPSDDGLVYFYWWDGDSTYAYTPTTISLDTFSSLLENFQADNVFFAFEGEALSSHLSTLDPLSMFYASTLGYPQLSATTPVWNEVSLLTQLGFNPYTKSRYTETNGTEVILQEDDQVYLRPNGTILYESHVDSAQLLLPLPADTQSAYTVASSASQLLHSLVGAMIGDATLSISGYTQTDTQIQITFAYQMNGIPIVLSNGGHAASITIEGNAITQLTIITRQYYASDTASLLLPLAQAAAVATPQSTLSLTYVDYTTEDVSLLWTY